MKTLFTTLLAVFCFILKEQYLFKTNNMLLFEMLVAAVPSAVITLQPNSERVKGKFIPYVLSRSIPGAITLILCVITMYLGFLFIPGELGGLTVDLILEEAVMNGETVVTPAVTVAAVNPLLMLAVTFGGLVMLYRVMQPFNLLRAFVYAFSVGVSILVLSIPVLGNIVYDNWDKVGFSFTQVLYLVCVILAAFPISNALMKLCDLMNPSE